MGMTQRTEYQGAVADAREGATQAVAGLVAALRETLDDRSWPRAIRSATDLASVSGINQKSAWMLYRTAHSSDALAEAGLLPKRGALRSLTDAASKCGVSKRRIKRTQDAYEEFDAVVRRIAGDRDTFSEMAASWSGQPASAASTAICRQAFRSNRLIWGLWTKVSFMTLIGLPPEPGAKTADEIMLRGLCSLSASRRGSWDLYGSLKQPGDVRASLACAGGAESTLLTRYCSGLLPKLERRVEGNWSVVGAEFEASGEVAQQTLVFGEQMLQAPTSGTLWASLESNFPTESLQVDLIVHRARRPHFLRHFLGAGRGHSDGDHGRRQISAVPIELIHHGNVQSGAAFSELPKYTALLDEVIRDVGHDPAEFELFRVSCKYPPTGVTLRIEVGYDDPAD